MIVVNSKTPHSLLLTLVYSPFAAFKTLDCLSNFILVHLTKVSPYKSEFIYHLFGSPYRSLTSEPKFTYPRKLKNPIKGGVTFLSVVEESRKDLITFSLDLDLVPCYYYLVP